MQASYFRRYIDEGRLHHLLWFILVSGGIAFVQWSLSPQVAYSWVPHDISGLISDRNYFILLFALASVWSVVVAIGFFKCGWPAFLMLTYAKWGLSPVYFLASVYWACLMNGNCL